jgi:hypothetical protein
MNIHQSMVAFAGALLLASAVAAHAGEIKVLALKA